MILSAAILLEHCLVIDGWTPEHSVYHIMYMHRWVTFKKNKISNSMIVYALE